MFHETGDVGRQNSTSSADRSTALCNLIFSSAILTCSLAILDQPIAGLFVTMSHRNGLWPEGWSSTLHPRLEGYIENMVDSTKQQNGELKATSWPIRITR